MTKRAAFFGAFLAAIIPSIGLAQHHGHSAQDAPYAGLQSRQIKGLSDQDIEELQQGSGWGLALPAELNGHPGPKHLLELSTELDLSSDQIAAITAIYQEMQAEAIAAGERFIAAEAALSDAFASGDITDETLQQLLAEAAEARAALRFVHLSRHLSTPALLSRAQIKRYNVLRGYADDPCANVPDGHDPQMWRRHNGCE
jgi:hypothetical protein